MTKKTFLTVTLFFCLALFAYHAITLKLHLFFISPILDIPSHILGGFVIALLLAHLAFDVLKDNKKIYQDTFIFGGVLIIGVLWEIFEIKFDFFLNYDNYRLDTSFDIIFDLLGAFLAHTYFVKRFYGR